MKRRKGSKLRKEVKYFGVSLSEDATDLKEQKAEFIYAIRYKQNSHAEKEILSKYDIVILDSDTENPEAGFMLVKRSNHKKKIVQKFATEIGELVFLPWMLFVVFAILHLCYYFIL